METIILIGIVICMILQVIVLLIINRHDKNTKLPQDGDKIELLRSDISKEQSNLKQEVSNMLQTSIKNFGDVITLNQSNSANLQTEKLENINKSITDKQELMNSNVQNQMKQLEERFKSFEITNEQKLEAIRENISTKLIKIQEDNNSSLNTMKSTVDDNLQKISNTVQTSIHGFSDVMIKNQKELSENQTKKLENIDKSITDKQELMNSNVQNQMRQLEERFKTLEMTNEQKLEAMRETISTRLSYIQEDNNKKLDEIKITVDDKLQKTLDEKMTNSFKLVSERLEQVYKGLGEMQNIASNVVDLQKMLSNVKTRGILGEIQLGAILDEILTPDQYDTEVPTVPNSKERVEFAIKLPAKDNDEYIYLPIDSKFPGDTYAHLQDAYMDGSPEEIKEAYKKLENVIKKCAKDIHDKYIYPPYTTNFAIMFLPFEGLYTEVVNHGLIEVLQRDYNVNVSGPSTMAALLNSLQLGFKTLQIQKRSNEVWEILSAVKTEFDTFEKAFETAKKRIQLLDEDMNKLIGTRTRAIKRKLREVQGIEMDTTTSKKILGIEDNLDD